MKLIAFTFLFLTLTATLTVAKSEKADATLKNVPKAAPTGSQGSKFNINEACKDSHSKAGCEAILKSLGGDKENVKPSSFAEKVVRHTQVELGHAATKARKQMREDDLDMKIKKALSHCVKMYLDMADVLRGTYLAVRSRNYGSEASSKFGKMARNFPRLCEEGLKQVGTSGEKLGVYKNYNELEDLACTLDGVVRYASAIKGGAKKN